METKRCGVLLVGYEEGENLGLRSLASFLMINGIDVQIISYKPDKKSTILNSCKLLNPEIVGFSLIFQRFLNDFAELIGYLRDNGIMAHFTMGGHFPTVESKMILEYIGGLDSIVRCEGEITLLELIKSIKSGSSLSDLRGLTFRSGKEIIKNESRSLIRELDALPFPLRNGCSFKILDLGVSTIISSRGCLYNCSFCSIHQFYRDSSGPKRRTRSPGNVIDEMELLYKNAGTRIFIFEDDDFFVNTGSQRSWLNGFINELKARNLEKEIVWRISCRIDDINEGVLKSMMEAGMLCVYLGIEAGNDSSLKTYEKRYTIETIRKSISVLEKLHLYYEFGFMILNPYCTLETIRADVDFLKEIGMSGMAITQFTKMVPYAGTAIEKRLKEEGRLAGSIDSPDYGYPDSRIALLEHFLHSAFHFRNFNPDGLVEKLRYLKFYISVLKKFYPDYYEGNNCGNRIEYFIKAANQEFLEKTSMAVTLINGKDENEIVKFWPILEEFIMETKTFEKNMAIELDKWYEKMELDLRR